MIPLYGELMERALLVQSLQTNPVLQIDRRLPQWQNDIRLSGGVELEVRALPGLHHRILIVLDHDEVLQLGEVDGVGLVLDGLLVVELGDEDAFVHVGLEMEGVVPVLGLDEEALYEVNIGAIVEHFPHKVTKHIVLAWTVGESINTLMLSSKCDQVLHGRIWTPLSNTAQKLATLREAYGIVPILKFRIFGNLPALHVNDVVCISNKTSDFISSNVVPDHESVHVGSGDGVLYDFLDAGHAKVGVPHAVPQHHGGGALLGDGGGAADGHQEDQGEDNKHPGGVQEV